MDELTAGKPRMVVLNRVDQADPEGTKRWAEHFRAKGYAVLESAAKSGVAAAAVLGMGRAVGETMAVIMVAGNQTRMPTGLFNGVSTLTGTIVMEMGYAADLHRQALIATAAVLFAFILLINLVFALIKNRSKM